VLVAIDDAPITELSFADVMRQLHATAATRPTRLEFVSVDRFQSADGAVAKWCQRQSFAARDEDDPRLREGEFEVSFAPQQPTGLRFSESYLMTTPLKLAHVETALLSALGLRSRHRDALVNTLLVRIDCDSVLGAPVDDVLAQLYDRDAFPKTLWLAQVDRLQSDYQVVTLTTREQLKWFCFVPCEIMMEVAVVSYAALATTSDLETADQTEPSPSHRARTRSRSRSDGICEHQYLMAINGFPTLRVSASTSFSDDEKVAAGDDDGGVVSVANASLDALLGHARTLRFRDLKAYRREFLAHAPLSPWQRRRRSRSRTNTSTSESSLARTPSAMASPMTAMELDSVFSSATPATDIAVRIEHRPQSFFQILIDQAQADPLVSGRGDSTATKTRYRGLAHCEGVRSFTPIASDDIKYVVVPDNRRAVGIQLETDTMASGRPVFKAFLRSDGPAMASRRVQAGDRIVEVNGISVDEIPTDVLVRILHGDDYSLTHGTPFEGSGSSKRGTSEPPRRRVLRLVKRDATANSNRLLSHAMKLLAMSKARLAVWKSSQSNNRTSLVQ
jgi:hypothetical protein